MIFGFYDCEGVFFYDWDSSRPDEHYSSGLAYGEESYAVRHEGKEIKLERETYKNLLEAAIAGKMDYVQHILKEKAYA